MSKINEFKGDYAFLSNFYPCTVVYCDRTFPSVEHAYKAIQYCHVHQIDWVDDLRFKDDFLLKCLNPNIKAGTIKKLSKEFTFLIRPDFHNYKALVMVKLLASKFSQNNPDLLRKLLNTGTTKLVEGNMWNDTYWGVCLKTNYGQNKLGILLMTLRDALLK